MSSNTTVFARSKEIEVMVVDALSVEEFIGDLRSLTVAMESFCLSPVEETLCHRRFESALSRARIDSSLLEYSAEGIRTGNVRILTALRELIERLLYELSVFWTESFGHAKRLRAKFEKFRNRASALTANRAKLSMVAGQFSITRVLAPTNDILSVPLAMASELKDANKAILGQYSTALNQWLLKLDRNDLLPPAPNYKSRNTLPGTPILYSRDNEAIVWGMRYQSNRSALDPNKSMMAVATRDELRKLCDLAWTALDQTVTYQREWHQTERALRKILADLRSVGPDGYEAAKARKLTYAAASLPRQWARFGLYLCAQLARYIEVCLDQYE